MNYQQGGQEDRNLTRDGDSVGCSDGCINNFNLRRAQTVYWVIFRLFWIIQLWRLLK